MVAPLINNTCVKIGASGLLYSDPYISHYPFQSRVARIHIIMWRKIPASSVQWVLTRSRHNRRPASRVPMAALLSSRALCFVKVGLDGLSTSNAKKIEALVPLPVVWSLHSTADLVRESYIRMKSYDKSFFITDHCVENRPRFLTESASNTGSWSSKSQAPLSPSN